MNRIILAYAPANATTAQSVDQALSRLGIPFEHIHHDMAAQLAASGEPMLLLVTDNLLTNQDCLKNLLPMLQSRAAANQLSVVLADGVDASGQPIPTQIDRMANALHYMKYWQDTWLALSDRHTQATGEERNALLAQLDEARAIANQIGDIIGFLRETGYKTWEQFSHNDFEAFFAAFGLQDWHGQYKRIAAQAIESQTNTEQVHLPEMPLAGGVLSFEPIPEPEPEWSVAPTETPAPEPVETVPPPVAEPEETQTPGIVFSTVEPENTLTQEQIAAKDAWLWIEKGHLQRGLDLFESAIEHFPESDWLKAEYARAKQLLPPEQEAENIPEPPVVPATPNMDTASDEAKSYDLMGDMAEQRGDYLFAKYCWDRVLEIAPEFPGIYRKLGLMTAEHLRDYRETAAIYLRKALELQPDDAEIRITLADIGRESAMASPLNPEPVVTVPQPEPEPEPEPIAPEPEPESEPVLETIPLETTEKTPAAQPLLVLITGATSGIGQATAEIFARNGHRLILTGRRVERLVALKNRLESEYGTEILLLPFDVREAGAVEAALGQLPDSFQDIDVLINNAGLAKGLAPIHEGKLEHWETMIDTNVKGLLYVTRMVSPGMVQRRRGHIVNISSSAGKEAYPNGNVYCATKFAVEALTKSMRFDLHPYNIRVSQVSPGHVEETEFALNRFDGDAEKAKIYNDFQPLKASDVADVIYFMVTRPAHVNVQDVQLFATQQASAMVVNRSGRDAQ